jgi:transcription elongation factor Elf1
MSNVIELDSRRPHLVEQQECTNCRHKQTSVQIDNKASYEREFWECAKCGFHCAVDVNGLRPHPEDCACQVCWYIANAPDPTAK